MFLRSAQNYIELFGFNISMRKHTALCSLWRGCVPWQKSQVQRRPLSWVKKRGDWLASWWTKSLMIPLEFYVCDRFVMMLFHSYIFLNLDRYTVYIYISPLSKEPGNLAWKPGFCWSLVDASQFSSCHMLPSQGLTWQAGDGFSSCPGGTQ